jgi:hypothetical protein
MEIHGALRGPRLARVRLADVIQRSVKYAILTAWRQRCCGTDGSRDPAAKPGARVIWRMEESQSSPSKILIMTTLPDALDLGQLPTRRSLFQSRLIARRIRDPCRSLDAAARHAHVTLNVWRWQMYLPRKPLSIIKTGYQQLIQNFIVNQPNFHVQLPILIFTIL